MRSLRSDGSAPHPENGHEAEDSILHRLDRLAQEQPDDPAIAGGGDQFSFAELATGVRAAGKRLGESGLSDRPVAVLMEHRALAVAASLSVLASGRAAAPLDPDFPEPRLEQIIKDIDPSILLCTPSTEGVARSLGAARVEVWERLPEPSADAPDLPRINGRSPAFLFYTSGSTGRPKGALTNHRAFLSGSEDLNSAGAYIESDRVAVAAPLNFAASACQILWPLLAGAEVELFPVRREGLPAFLEWMDATYVTAFATVPTLARAMGSALAGRTLSKLRVVVVGGEQVALSDVELIRRMGREPVDVVTVYVSTETMLMAWNKIPGREQLDRGCEITLGRPVEGRELDLDPLPDSDGRLGEIVVSSNVFGSGYLNEPVLNKLKFDIDQQSDRMTYRTGDVGRWTDDGTIVYVGRVDSQVKVRGNRIDLGDLEAAARALDEVSAAAAVPTKNSHGDTAVALHLTIGDAAEKGSERDLRRKLIATVPEYMVPATITIHDSLPTLPTGKIDRVALSTMTSVAEPDPVAVPVEPDSLGQVLRLARQVLDDVEVEAGDDFFELGGDSLTAMRLLVEIEEQLDTRIAMSAWIERPTLLALAQQVDDSSRRSTANADWGTIVRLQRGDPSVPSLLIVNDLHSSALRMSLLARSLGADQPVWGTDSPLLHPSPDPPTSFEQIAEKHLSDLGRTLPSDPIHLLGYSSNSLLAFELARQLSLAGREVGYLGFIDFGPVHVRHRLNHREGPRPPGAWPLRSDSALPWNRRVAAGFREVASADRGSKLWTISRVLDFPKLHDLAAAEVDLRRRGYVRASLRGSYAWYRQMDMAIAYDPPPTDLDAVLFVSDQTSKGNIDVSHRLDHNSATEATFGWASVLRTVEVVDVVGAHNDLTKEPYVAGVGAAIRRSFRAFVGE